MSPLPARRFVGFVLVASVAAQEPALAPEYALLKEMAGNWSVTTTGPTTNQRARVSTQLESSELVCGGLWLESLTRAGDNEMYWLTGFDPGKRCFVRLRVAGSAEAVLEDGEFDASQRTITFHGRSAMAKRTRKPYVVTLAATGRVDRAYGLGGEKPFMELVFARAKAGERAVPKEKLAKAPTPEHELLAQLAGEWDCALTATMPGLDKPMRSEGSLREEVVGDGYWLRSSFESEFGGSRIEGRGLMGFDQKEKRYVRYWVDNGSPVLAVSTSVLDDTGKKLIGTGTTQMPGGEVTVAEEAELGADQRRVVQRLSTSDGKDAGTFEMVLTRRPPPKAK
jgi:hypothetical protein